MSYRMVPHRFGALWGLAAVICSSHPVAWAEPPSLTRLLPAGAQRGTTARVEVTGKYEQEQVEVWTSRAGIHWQAKDEDNQFDVTVEPDVPPGRVWVRLFNDDEASDLLPFIVGHFPERIEVEPNDLLAEAESIEQAPLLIHGVLQQRGDVDHFRVALTAGQTLIASVQAERELNSEADVSLQLVTTDGHIIAQNLDYHGLDPQLAWTAKQDQELIVRLFAFPAAPNSTIAFSGGDQYLYRLTLTTGPFVEGVMPSSLTRDRATELRPVGWNLESPSSTQAVPTNDDGETYQFFLDGVPGRFDLPIVEGDSVASATTQIAEDSGDAPSRISQTVSPPVHVTGSLDRPGQRDVYEFTAAAESQWRVSVDSRSLGYPPDVVLEIEDAESGKTLQREDDTSRQPDPRLQWKAPADGHYRVVASELNGQSGAHHLYRLAIAPMRPAVTLTVEEDRFEMKLGEPQEIAVKIDRQGGYSDRLRVVLADAVDGLDVDSPISAPDDDSSKQIQVKVTATEPLNRPVRLRAQIVGDDDLAPTDQPDSLKSSSARYSIRHSKTSLEPLWITAK